MVRPEICTTLKAASNKTAVRAARPRGHAAQVTWFSVSKAVHLGGENIATAAHRLDQLGVSSVIFELAAEPADRDVDGAIERPGLAPAQQVEQHVTGQHLVRTV